LSSPCRPSKERIPIYRILQDKTPAVNKGFCEVNSETLELYIAEIVFFVLDWFGIAGAGKMIPNIVKAGSCVY
jgi:hypothetical protein